MVPRPHFIATQHGHLEVLRALIQAGASIDQTKGSSSLYLAAEKGHIEGVRALRQEGRASVDQATEGGRVHLHVAAKHGHLEVVRALIQEGRASIDQVSNRGRTPFYAGLEATEFNLRTLGPIPHRVWCPRAVLYRLGRCGGQAEAVNRPVVGWSPSSRRLNTSRVIASCLVVHCRTQRTAIDFV